MNQFFKSNNNKKGEIFELKRDLNSSYKHTRKQTLKKVIQNMTMGKDSSQLFPDVAKLISTEDLELKKLVYLYLINYAKTQPELVILVVNTFVMDAAHPNPIVRSLAIRTMGLLKVEKIFNYLMDPLKNCLQDKDPYVRKTACFSVLKLFDLNPQLCIENGLLTMLQELLSDPNPTVISNACCCLLEIQQFLPDVLQITDYILQKLLAALNDSTEWGQIYILDVLCKFESKNQQILTEVCERVFPRLQHVNSSVVLSCVKLLVVYLQRGLTQETSHLIIRKLGPPLVTLLSSEPEIQYVALKNINLILMKNSSILSDNCQVFFTKFSDPQYVKLEKLEILVKLVNINNIDTVIMELKEYCNEVDTLFSRAAVKAIAKCCLKIPDRSDKIVSILLDLMQVGVEHILQESMIVIQDILRKYPKYTTILPSICKLVDKVVEEEAKFSMVWIVGEYSADIGNCNEILEYFVGNFEYEHVRVQQCLLTAVMKSFAKGGSSDLVEHCLTVAKQSENPDIRDRAYLYYRLVQSGPENCRQVLLARLPEIEINPKITDELLVELLGEIGTIASVVYKPAKLVQNLEQINVEYVNEMYSF